MHARRAPESVDDEPRIVGNRRQTGGRAGRPRLEDGVLDEGRGALLHSFHAELGLDDHFPAAAKRKA